MISAKKTNGSLLFNIIAVSSIMFGVGQYKQAFAVIQSIDDEPSKPMNLTTRYLLVPLIQEIVTPESIPDKEAEKKSSQVKRLGISIPPETVLNIVSFVFDKNLLQSESGDFRLAKNRKELSQIVKTFSPISRKLRSISNNFIGHIVKVNRDKVTGDGNGEGLFLLRADFSGTRLPRLNLNSAFLRESNFSNSTFLVEHLDKEEKLKKFDKFYSVHLQEMDHMLQDNDEYSTQANISSFKEALSNDKNGSYYKSASATVNYSTLKNSDLIGANFTNCIIWFAKIENSALMNSHFNGTTLMDVSFKESDLFGASFSSIAKFKLFPYPRRTIESQTKINQTRFSKANIKSVTFEGAIIELSNFNSANTDSSTSFKGAHIVKSQALSTQFAEKFRSSYQNEIVIR